MVGLQGDSVTGKVFRIRSEFVINAESAELAFGIVGEYFSMLGNENETACWTIKKQFKTYSYCLDLLDDDGHPIYVHEHDESCMSKDEEDEP